MGQGVIKPPLVDFDRPTFENLRRRSGGSLTCMQRLVAQLMLIALEIVEHYVSVWESCDAQLQGIQKKDNEINHRQRTILNRAMRKPEAEFTISFHQSKHDIAYPTARADFLELVKKGCLEQRKQGKAFIFKASRHLEEMFINQQNLSSLNKFSILKSCIDNLAWHKESASEK